jgi:rubrerythrin
MHIMYLYLLWVSGTKVFPKKKAVEETMIAQKMITSDTPKNHEMAVQEAIRLLSRRPLPQRWTCEVCGMLHTEVSPAACDSCGASSFAPQTNTHLEMHSRW